jgi:hypothetical protein
MSTASVCGYTGSVSGIGGLTEVTNFEITLTVDISEATSFDSGGWKMRIPCLQGATGTFRCVGVSSTVGLHAGCTFKTANAGGMTIAGDIIISRIAVGNPVDGMVTFVHDFTFTGPITVS